MSSISIRWRVNVGANSLRNTKELQVSNKALENYISYLRRSGIHFFYGRQQFNSGSAQTWHHLWCILQELSWERGLYFVLYGCSLQPVALSMPENVNAVQVHWAVCVCDPYTQLYPPLKTVFMCALVTDLQGNTEINSTLVLLTVHSTLKQTFFAKSLSFLYFLDIT